MRASAPFIDAIVTRNRGVGFCLAIVLACLVAGAAASVWLGQDANWDLRNYHLYIRAAPTLHSRFWKLAARRYERIEIPRSIRAWSYASFVSAAGCAARGKRFVDEFDFQWLRPAEYPREFDRHIRPRSLCILAPQLKQRALDAMDRANDLLAEVDGVLVLSPGWKRCGQCARMGSRPSLPAP